MLERSKLKAIAAVVLGEVIFGLTFLFSKIALRIATPMVLIADRYILAFIAMTLVILLTRQRLHYRGKNLFKIALLSLCQPVVYFVCETYGLLWSTTVFASIMIALVPVAAALLSAVFLGERTKPAQFVLILLSVLGVVIMALRGRSEGTLTIPGFLCLLGAVLCGAGYNVASRSASAEFTPLERTYAMVVCGLIVFPLLALLETHGSVSALLTPFLTPDYLFCVPFLGLVASIGAFFLLNFANTFLTAAQTASFSSLVPVVSMFAGVLLLGEHLSLVEVGATALIILSVLGIQLLA